MRLIREYILPRLVVDIILFYLLLMLLGFLAAELEFNLAFVAGAIANYLLLVFAFVFNDIQDRQDDAKSTFKAQSWTDNLRMMVGLPTKEPKPAGAKRFKNPFAFGDVSVRMGYLVSILLVVSALAISLYAGGWRVFLVAFANAFVGYLYSVQAVRLKSRPGLDILSHAFLLAAVQVAYFMAYPEANRDFFGWLILDFAFLISVAGDLRNEYRDFEEDQEAGIKNMATILGKSTTAAAGNLLYLVSLFSIIGLVVLEIWSRLTA